MIFYKTFKNKNKNIQLVISKRTVTNVKTIIKGSVGFSASSMIALNRFNSHKENKMNELNKINQIEVNELEIIRFARSNFESKIQKNGLTYRFLQEKEIERRLLKKSINENIIKDVESIKHVVKQIVPTKYKKHFMGFREKNISSIESKVNEELDSLIIGEGLELVENITHSLICDDET